MKWHQHENITYSSLFFVCNHNKTSQHKKKRDKNFRGSESLDLCVLSADLVKGYEWNVFWRDWVSLYVMFNGLTTTIEVNKDKEKQKSFGHTFDIGVRERFSIDFIIVILLKQKWQHKPQHVHVSPMLKILIGHFLLNVVSWNATVNEFLATMKACRSPIWSFRSREQEIVSRTFINFCLTGSFQQELMF